MKITLKEARRLVQGRIAGCSSYNRSQVDDTIHLALVKAWNSGQWHNMTHRLCTRILNKRIVLPSDYGVLEAINWQGVPRPIQNNWFVFNPSGPGTRRCNWDRAIYDLQDVPTVWIIERGERVLAVSASPNGEDPDARVTIQGINSDGKYIYRYFQTVSGSEVEKHSDSGEQLKIATIQENGQYDSAYSTYNDFARDGISAILKPETRGPITIYAQGPTYIRELVTLQPGQTQSTLRAYHVPDGCACGEYVDILARKAEPEKPVHDDQILQIENPDALIALCMSVYYDYDTMNPELAEVYFNKGIRALNGQLQEQLGTSIQLPRVWSASASVRNKRRNVNPY